MILNYSADGVRMGELITGQAATYVEEIWVETKQRYEIMCITRDVQRVVAESGITDGLVLVNPMHITASCYVNDLEYGLHHDIMKWLEKIAHSTVLKVRMAKNIIIIERAKITETRTLSGNY